MNEGNHIAREGRTLRKRFTGDRIPSCLAAGSCLVYTMNLAERHGNRLLVERVDVLRTAFRTVRARKPFRLEALVILPDYAEKRKGARLD